MTNPSAIRVLSPALVLVAGLTAQRVQELEPNDTVQQAQPLQPGQHVLANLAAGERDWFTFTLAAAAEVHVTTAGNFAVNPSVDTAVLLYDATGTTRLAWNDNARGNHSDCGVNLQPGTYTCLVVGKTATTAGDYGLDFLVLPAATIDVAESAEPNGDPMLGGNPTPIVLGDTFAGSLSSPTDSDWYQFVLAAPSVVQAIVYDDSAAPQLDNTMIRLYQESNPGVYLAVGTSSTLATGHRAFNLGHGGTLPAGNYAIEITAGTAATGTAPLDYVKTGNYAVRTRGIVMGTGSQILETPEPNTSVGTASYMSLGDYAIGNCSGQNEADWYGFSVPGATTIAAMVDNWGTTPITDTTLRLLDANGTLISSASSGGAAGTSHGKLVFTVPTPGIYYLEVSGGLFAATGDYVLLTGSCVPMFVSASWRAEPPSTNACPGSNGLRPALTVASSEVPQLGSTFVIRLQNALPNAPMLPYFGFSRTLANGSVPLPIDLSAIGAPGCFVRVDPASTRLLLANASGVGEVDIAIPAMLSMRGLQFYLQAVLLDPANNALGISVSNDARFITGERGY